MTSPTIAHRGLSVRIPLRCSRARRSRRPPDPSTCPARVSHSRHKRVPFSQAKPCKDTPSQTLRTPLAFSFHLDGSDDPASELQVVGYYNLSPVRPRSAKVRERTPFSNDQTLRICARSIDEAFRFWRLSQWRFDSSLGGAFRFFHRRIVEKAFAALEAFLIVDATDFDFSLAMVRRVPSTPHGAKPAAGRKGGLCQL